MPDTATLNPAELSDSDFQKFLDAAKTTGQRQEGVTFPPDTQAAIDRSTASIPRVDASKYIGPEAARMGARPKPSWTSAQVPRQVCELNWAWTRTG
jgi:hypothetical protein